MLPEKFCTWVCLQQNWTYNLQLCALIIFSGLCIQQELQISNISIQPSVFIFVEILYQRVMWLKYVVAHLNLDLCKNRLSGSSCCSLFSLEGIFLAFLDFAVMALFVF